MSVGAFSCPKKLTSIEMPLSRRYEQLLLSENHSDCTFLVGGISVKCHKLILSCASPVFDAMFYGSMREKESIEIRDINAAIFQKLVYYIYAGNINLDSDSIEDVIELCYGAEKYLLNDLNKLCLNAVKRKLRFDNILSALELCFCTNLEPLLQICITFFTQYCLKNVQFKSYIKNNYIHLSKDCFTTIIENNTDLNYSIWFTLEWCKHECDLLGIQLNESNLVFNDLQIDMSMIKSNDEQINEESEQFCNTIERTHYKACRPYTINSNNLDWNIAIKPNRYMSLIGLVINSRLKPNSYGLTRHCNANLNEYRENFQIEIQSKAMLNNEDGYEVVLKHFVDNDCTKYNCSLNVMFKNSVVLMPDMIYFIKLTWNSNAFGAEYPCFMQSNEVDGISFLDVTTHMGSFVKGLRFLNS